MVGAIFYEASYFTLSLLAPGRDAPLPTSAGQRSQPDKRHRAPGRITSRYFTSRTDDYVSHGTATRECQQMGYADASFVWSSAGRNP